MSDTEPTIADLRGNVEAFTERLRVAREEHDHEDTIAGLRHELMDARSALAEAMEQAEAPDAYDVVEAHWPYDGPYSPQHTRAAAVMLGRLVRYLNNATQKTHGLEVAATVSSVLGEMNSAQYGYDQLLLQLLQFIDKQAKAGDLYDDRAFNDAERGRLTGIELVQALDEARAAAGTFRRSLDNAVRLASRLGNITPPEA